MSVGFMSLGNSAVPAGCVAGVSDWRNGLIRSQMTLCGNALFNLTMIIVKIYRWNRRINECKGADM